MKKILVVILLLGLGVIIYFFVKEQFQGIVLSHDENILLSVLYLVVGICVLALGALKFPENNKK
jgi:hypothetical protein